MDHQIKTTEKKLKKFQESTAVANKLCDTCASIPAAVSHVVKFPHRLTTPYNLSDYYHKVIIMYYYYYSA